jgi:hypothetical protein
MCAKWGVATQLAGNGSAPWLEIENIRAHPRKSEDV